MDALGYSVQAGHMNSTKREHTRSGNSGHAEGRLDFSEGLSELGQS